MRSPGVGVAPGGGRLQLAGVGLQRFAV